MRLRFLRLYENLIDSFWFLPLLMVVFSIVAALGSVTLDHAVGSRWVSRINWVWSGSANGARSVLSTVASSLITVVSIVFSLTISTLAQTSSHFGPRVLRNFTTDRRNQLTLGTLVATFTYCLLVLRTVRSVEESTFVPYISVNIGVALTLLSLAVLIYFIHHITETIQAETLIAAVADDFQRAIPLLFPARIGEGESANREEEIPEDSRWENAPAVESVASGYVQRIDDKRLLALAKQNDLLIRLQRRPGDFVTQGALLMQVLPAQHCTEKLKRQLSECLSVGTYRTPHQDAAYSLQQLAEMAARALSPGVNEPFTALNCIDWMGASLQGVAQRDIPSPLRYDDTGELRVIAQPLSFRELANIAFEPIRVYGASAADILVRLIDVIAEIAPQIHRKDDTSALLHHLDLIEQGLGQIKSDSERSRVETHLRQTRRTLATEV